MSDFAYPMVITYAGYEKLQRHKGLFDITHFGVSDQKGELDPRRTTPKPLRYKGEVELGEIQDEHTVKYYAKIPAGLEPFEVREVYLFLDDGTLFAIGHPRVEIKKPDGTTELKDHFLYTGITEKPLEIGVAMANITKLLALKHVPMDEFEQSTVIFHAVSVLGDEILSLSKTLTLLEGDYRQLKAKVNRLLNQHSERLSEQEKLTFELQLLLLQAISTLGDAINNLAKDISALKAQIFKEV